MILSIAILVPYQRVRDGQITHNDSICYASSASRDKDLKPSDLRQYCEISADQLPVEFLHVCLQRRQLQCHHQARLHDLPTNIATIVTTAQSKYTLMVQIYTECFNVRKVRGPKKKSGYQSR